MSALVTPLVAALTGLALLVAAAPSAYADGTPSTSGLVSGVDGAALPALARRSLPLIGDLTATACPELPPSWVVAQVQAESGWDTRARSASPGGTAGLYQMTQAAWIAAGGSPWASDPPADGAPVLTTETHLRVAIPWVCANLRAVTAHLTATGKPTAPLDAMLVCHIAGCDRVTGSRTGVPAPGEAGCDDRCVQLVQRYLDAVHDNLRRFAAVTGPRLPEAPVEQAVTPLLATQTDLTPLMPGIPAMLAALRAVASAPRAAAPAAAPAAAGPAAYGVAPAAASVAPAAAAAWRGGATGCAAADPTGGACLTGATRHGLDAVSAAFGGFRGGPVVHSTGCWDQHAWNPSSDHSRGKACDFMVTRPGTFAQGGELQHGWTVANWLRANAAPLQIKYLIWQGRYWDPSVHDQPGNWGIRYTGGGIYDIRNATGGHYDHVHASFRE